MGCVYDVLGWWHLLSWMGECIFYPLKPSSICAGKNSNQEFLGWSFCVFRYNGGKGALLNSPQCTIVLSVVYGRFQGALNWSPRDASLSDSYTPPDCFFFSRVFSDLSAPHENIPSREIFPNRGKSNPNQILFTKRNSVCCSKSICKCNLISV